MPQPFDIDVRLEVDLANARRTDALAETIDYDKLHKTIVAIVRDRSYDLLERLGQDMIDVILADPRIAAASVSIGKPQLLAGATPVVTLRAQRS